MRLPLGARLLIIDQTIDRFRRPSSAALCAPQCARHNGVLLGESSDSELPIQLRIQNPNLKSNLDGVQSIRQVTMRKQFAGGEPVDLEKESAY